MHTYNKGKFLPKVTLNNLTDKCLLKAMHSLPMVTLNNLTGRCLPKVMRNLLTDKCLLKGKHRRIKCLLRAILNNPTVTLNSPMVIPNSLMAILNNPMGRCLPKALPLPKAHLHPHLLPRRQYALSAVNLFNPAQRYVLAANSWYNQVII